MSNVPEKWIKAQDGSLINLTQVTQILKRVNYDKTFNVKVCFPGLAFWPSEETTIENWTYLAHNLSEDEADALMNSLEIVLGRVFEVSPLLDAVRGTLPETEEGQV